MATFKTDIKKLKKGELAGNICAAVCAATFVFFIVCFPVARTQGLETLETVTLIISPALIAVGAALSAFCGFKYGGAVDKAVKHYILDCFAENPASLHPERNSLTFNVGISDTEAEIKANGYKDGIILDFSEFGKLSFSRKNFISSEIRTRLCVTFLKLYERGNAYSAVSVVERYERKSSSPFNVIINGKPDGNAYKLYLKNR